MTIKPTNYHIQSIGSGALFAMPMPRAAMLTDDLTAIRMQGISKVLSLMEIGESEALGLQDQPSICNNIGMEFQRFAIPDYGVPDLPNLQKLIKQLHAEVSDGLNILVHCRGGMGRTGLICSCLLIYTGFSSAEAIAQTAKKRGCAVPETPAQFECIRQFELSIKP